MIASQYKSHSTFKQFLQESYQEWQEISGPKPAYWMGDVILFRDADGQETKGHILGVAGRVKMNGATLDCVYVYAVDCFDYRTMPYCGIEESAIIHRISSLEPK